MFHTQLLVVIDFLGRNATPCTRRAFRPALIRRFSAFSSGGYCELSDVELRDLKPYQAFNADDRFLLFTWDFDERQCFSSPAAKFPTVSSCMTSILRFTNIYIYIRFCTFFFYRIRFFVFNVVPDGLQWTWMRFTVNGQPCRSGSFCSRNTDVGVWSCPVDQGEWDYCCRPDHKCGYSEGISYPWLVDEQFRNVCRCYCFF